MSSSEVTLRYEGKRIECARMVGDELQAPRHYAFQTRVRG